MIRKAGSGFPVLLAPSSDYLFVQAQLKAQINRLKHFSNYPHPLYTHFALCSSSLQPATPYARLHTYYTHTYTYKLMKTEERHSKRMKQEHEEDKKSNIPVLPWMRSPIDVDSIPKCPLDQVPLLDSKYCFFTPLLLFFSNLL